MIKCYHQSGNHKKNLFMIYSEKLSLFSVELIEFLKFINTTLNKLKIQFSLRTATCHFGINPTGDSRVFIF